MQLTLIIVSPADDILDNGWQKVWLETGGSIGRADSNDWVLPNSEISRFHGRIYFLNNQFYIEDISTNGIFIGSREQRVERSMPQQLNDGDQLFIGPYDINVLIEGGETFSHASENDNKPVQATNVEEVVENEQTPEAESHYSFSAGRESLSQHLPDFSQSDAPPLEKLTSSPSTPQSTTNLIPEDWMGDSVDALLSDWEPPKLNMVGSEDKLAISSENVEPVVVDEFYSSVQSLFDELMTYLTQEERERLTENAGVSLDALLKKLYQKHIKHQ